MGAILERMMLCCCGDEPGDESGDNFALGYEMRLEETDLGNGIVVGGHPIQTEYQEIVHGLCPRLIED
jgi:hypothetical protein